MQPTYTDYHVISMSSPHAFCHPNGQQVRMDSQSQGGPWACINHLSILVTLPLPLTMGHSHLRCSLPGGHSLPVGMCTDHALDSYHMTQYWVVGVEYDIVKSNA
jgi:hypothetical protein